MKLQPLNPNLERTDVLREKHRYGLWFGLFVGLEFSFFAWGIDSFVLSTHHGLFPWLKFAIGAVICMAVGAAAGWLAALSDKALVALVIWLITGFLFAWLAVHLPLTLLPRAMPLLEPQLGELLHYQYFSDFRQGIGLAYVWLAIFLAITGILQVPMSHSAVFSTSVLGKVMPILTALVLMGIAGSLLDNGLFNQPMRQSTLAVDRTLQFILANQGQEMNSAEARRMHAAAFRPVEGSISSEYRLVVSGYESDFVDLTVLIRFEREWVECEVVFNQPVLCEVVGSVP
ncbi:MAG: hypothetical protein HRF47_02855 [Chloroflexota bacterium]|jgi:hypothetical protein